MSPVIRTILVLILSLLGTALSTAAAGPGVWSYQGRLTDSLGNPLSGTVDLEFRVYQDFGSSWVVHWTELHTEVPLTNGLFTVELGKEVPFPDNMLGYSGLRLGVSVNGDDWRDISQPLTSVPYSSRTETISGATGGWIDGDVWIRNGASIENWNDYGALSVGSSPSLTMDGDEIHGRGTSLWLQKLGGDLGIGPNETLAKVHVTGETIELPDTALKNESMIIEDDDAILGLYSDEGGIAGSAVTLGEIQSGELATKWSMIRETSNGGNGLRLAFGTSRNPFNNPVRLYVDNTGEVGIGTRNPNYDLDVRGTIGNNSTQYHSDRRWKKNIRTFDSALDRVSRLRGVSFEWRRGEFADMNFPEGTRVGLIAQEVEEVVPELVHTNKDGYKSVEYANLVAVLIEAVKKLRTENQSQDDRIEMLESELRQLQAQL